MDTQKESLAICYLCGRGSVTFDGRFRPVCREHEETTDIRAPFNAVSPVTGGLSEDRPTVNQEQVSSLNSSSTVDERSRTPVSRGPGDSRLGARSLALGVPNADPVNTEAVILSPQTDITVHLGTEHDGPAEDSNKVPHVRQSAAGSQSPGSSTPTQTRSRSVRRPLPSQAQRRGDG